MTAEDLLTRTLTGVTESTEYPTTPMSAVVTRSRAIRGGRRRRIAALAAAAVVLAGGLSTTLLLGRGDDSTPGPTGPLGELPQGPAPELDYLDGDTFVASTGERASSPTFARAAEAVRSTSGVLVASRGTTRHPNGSISVVTGGVATRLGCGALSFAVPSDGGDPVYWLDAGCRPASGGALVQGDTRIDTAKGATFAPVGLTAGGVVVFTLSSGLRLPSHALVIPSGGLRNAIPLRLSMPTATSAAAGLVAGRARGFQRSAVVDATTGAVLWRASPAWTLQKFSGSGRYLAGFQSVGVQQSADVGDIVGIWDAATGRQVLQKVLPGLTVDAEAWEGDDSVLVVAEDRHGQEAILRIGLDGSVTRTTSVVAGVPRPAEGRPPLTTLRLAATP
jgi:hypothetical protein